MISIAIVEDDKSVSDQLESYIRMLQEEKGEEFSVKAYGDALLFLDEYKSQYDIILFDIELPSINGMEAAERIREADEEVIIIFVTYMAQFAVKGYGVHAFDFIVKPVSYFPFSQKLWKAVREKLSRKEASLIVKTAEGLERLSIGKITYLEVSGHIVQIHMTDKTVAVRCSISEMEDKLQPYHFLRCNVCYLINPVHIDKITENQVVVKGEPLAISRAKKKQFLTKLAEYFSEKRGT